MWNFTLNFAIFFKRIDFNMVFEYYNIVAVTFAMASVDRWFCSSSGCSPRRCCCSCCGRCWYSSKCRSNCCCSRYNWRQISRRSFGWSSGRCGWILWFWSRLINVAIWPHTRVFCWTFRQMFAIWLEVADLVWWTSDTLTNAVLITIFCVQERLFLF